MEAALQETREPQADRLHSNDPFEFESGLQQNIEDGDDQNQMMPSTDNEQTSDSRVNGSDCNDVEETGKELVVNGQGSDNEGRVSPESRTDFLEETNENDKNKEETNKEWITVG